MNNDEFQTKLSGILAEIRTLPEDQQARLLSLVEETRQRHLQLAESFRRFHDMVDDWRLATKYLIFDLERTRYEADQLRNEKNGK
jgi:hypothetical protein